jgi:Spy/CpxP family protein refolding chaperone
MRRTDISGTIIACGLLLGLAFPAASLAQPPGAGDGPHHRWGHRGGPEPDRFIARHAEELGLSSEALEAIDKIVDESHARAKTLHEELRTQFDTMHQLLTQEMPDEAAVMAQADVIGALKVEEQKNRLRALIAIRNQLTPEQRQELIRIREERMSPDRKRGPLGMCGDDIANLCPEAEPGQAVLGCLSGNWAELSEECRAVFEGGPPGEFGRGPGFGPPGP